MTTPELRDYFAAAALTGMLANLHTWKMNGREQLTPEEIARMCYVSSDALIAERSKNLKEE